MKQNKSNQKVIKLKNTGRKSKTARFDNKVIGIALVIAVAIGGFLGFRPNAYQITIAEKVVGAVKDEKIVEAARDTVKAQLESTYNAEIKFEDEIELKKYHAKKRDYIDPTYLVTYIRKNMNVLIAFKEIYVEGKPVGIVASDEEVEVLKAALKKEYYGNKEVEVDFGKKVEIKTAFAKESDLINMDTLVEKCAVTTPKIVTYEVKAGDSLWGIANQLGVSIENIKKENQGFTDTTVLKIGDKLKAKINEPMLPLIVTKDLTIEQETVDDGKKEQ
ncbi:MAG: LysM peptidoglycan-binding protein [Clostridia bacterium]|jgi:LysM repeat protein|nr:LysM peptidoglycan-binding protein [Clostridia bacterium]